MPLMRSYRHPQTLYNSRHVFKSFYTFSISMCTYKVVLKEHILSIFTDTLYIQIHTESILTETPFSTNGFNAFLQADTQIVSLVIVISFVALID